MPCILSACDITSLYPMGIVSLASHTLQSPRERGSDNFAYIELYMLQDPAWSDESDGSFSALR